MQNLRVKLRTTLAIIKCTKPRPRAYIKHVCFSLLALALVFAFNVDFVVGRFQPSRGNTGGTPRSKIHKTTRTCFVHLITARLEHGICSKIYLQKPDLESAGLTQAMRICCFVSRILQKAYAVAIACSFTLQHNNSFCFCWVLAAHETQMPTESRLH